MSLLPPASRTETNKIHDAVRLDKVCLNNPVKRLAVEDLEGCAVRDAGVVDQHMNLPHQSGWFKLVGGGFGLGRREPPPTPTVPAG
jgi:uncharacterized protein (DUF2342 family)